jgi:hypothetical protein
MIHQLGRAREYQACVFALARTNDLRDFQGELFISARN